VSVYECRRCQHQQDTAWDGFCPGCNGPYRFKKVGVDSADQKQKSTFAAAAESQLVHIPTGIAGFDRMTGGGLVAGTVILMGGERGAGKSTLLCLLADAVAKIKGKSLYASSEEAVSGVMSIAHRLELRNPDVEVLGNQLSIEGVLKHALETKPFFSVYDSLQKYASDTSGGAPGSRAQEEAVVSAIIAHHRDRKTCGIVVNQLDKAGLMKGSTSAAHATDAVFVLGYPRDEDEDAPHGEGIRVLVVDGKSRLGADNIKTYWKMHGEGDEHPGLLENIPPRSRLVDEVPRRGKYRKRDEDDARD
jgi:DNA repair protein RadA/Sms